MLTFRGNLCESFVVLGRVSIHNWGWPMDPLVVLAYGAEQAPPLIGSTVAPDCGKSPSC